jgi:DNA-binding transcriptional ArsR family regulator
MQESSLYALTCICLYGNLRRMSAVALRALGEPHRVAILDRLRDGERPVGDLVERLELSQPAVSKHLRVLRDAGLVEARTDAQRRLYRVRPEPLADLDEWLAPYRRLWEKHLDKLEDHLDRRSKQ